MNVDKIEKAWLEFVHALAMQNTIMTHIIIDRPIYANSRGVQSELADVKVSNLHGVEVIYAPR